MHIRIDGINSDVMEKVFAAPGEAIARWGAVVSGVMLSMGAADSSDAEIERCIGGCVGQDMLMCVALAMRSAGHSLVPAPTDLQPEQCFGFLVV